MSVGPSAADIDQGNGLVSFVPTGDIAQYLNELREPQRQNTGCLGQICTQWSYEYWKSDCPFAHCLQGSSQTALRRSAQSVSERGAVSASGGKKIPCTRRGNAVGASSERALILMVRSATIKITDRYIYRSNPDSGLLCRSATGLTLIQFRLQLLLRRLEHFWLLRRTIVGISKTNKRDSCGDWRVGFVHSFERHNSSVLELINEVISTFVLRPASHSEAARVGPLDWLALVDDDTNTALRIHPKW